VFLIGVLASLSKVASMATVRLEVSFWAYAGFSVAFTWMLVRMNRHQFWNALISMPDPDPGNAVTAKEAHLANCHTCGHLTPADQRRCRRCHSRIHLRTPNSLQMTGALLVTAGLLYIPANFLPITQTVQLGRVMDSTIVGGAVYLWEDHSYGVALIIFLASVLVPILKLLALSWLSWGVARQTIRYPVERTRLFRMLEVIGRWSMVDVFVVAILVGLIQLGDILTIFPGTAALHFTGVVILTMFAAKRFDQRLIWDSLGERQ
jgi:paraquat-inducible protein A